MNNAGEFQKILNRLMNDGSTGPNPTPSPSSSWDHPRIFESNQPFFSARKVATPPKKNPYPRVIRRAAPKATPPAPTPASKVIRTVEASLSFFALGANGQNAYRALVALGAGLDKSALTKSQLKREFRRLAKRWHPDSGQSAHPEKFMKLKSAERTLAQELENALASQKAPSK